MALQVIYNAAILINSVDLSGKAKKARVSFGTEKKDATAFGNVTRGYVVGLGTQMAEVTFYLDPSTGSVIQTLRPLCTALSTGFPINIRRTNSAASSQNEAYSMTAIIDGGIDVINGAVGDLEEYNVKFAPYIGSSWAVQSTSS